MKIEAPKLKPISLMETPLSELMKLKILKRFHYTSNSEGSSLILETTPELKKYNSLIEKESV